MFEDISYCNITTKMLPWSPVNKLGTNNEQPQFAKVNKVQ